MPRTSKSEANDAAPVMDNTPPTTPESSTSTISGSPTAERGGSLPPLDNDSIKSARDSSDLESMDCNKDHYSEDSLNVEGGTELKGKEGKGPLKRSKPDADKGEEPYPPKKRRARRKRTGEEELPRRMRPRQFPGRGGARMPLAAMAVGSDSDEPSNTVANSISALMRANSPRPSKYNFCVELDPELDGDQRIAVLQQKLQELRKTYVAVKAELACIDRRRKKIRRKEKEEKSAKQEAVCS